MSHRISVGLDRIIEIVEAVAAQRMRAKPARGATTGLIPDPHEEIQRTADMAVVFIYEQQAQLVCFAFIVAAHLECQPLRSCSAESIETRAAAEYSVHDYGEYESASEPLQVVAVRVVREFMGEDHRDLVFALGLPEQTTVDQDSSAGDGRSVGDRAVDHDHPVPELTRG